MGYYDAKYRLSHALDHLSETGLPVDRDHQASLHSYIKSEEEKLSLELQKLIPDELKPLHPKGGYKAKYVRLNGKTVRFPDPWPLPVFTVDGVDFVRRRFAVPVGPVGAFTKQDSLAPYMHGTPEYQERLSNMFVDRWCKQLPFNANSHDQLLSYLHYKNYRIPKHIDTGKDTTNRTELEKLITETDDEVLKLVGKMKKLTKLTGYASGDWIPGGDGRVHADFKFGSATGQITATKPPVQTYPEHYDPADEWIGDIMHRVKGTIRAQEGHKIVKIDMTGFHASMQGFLAEDAAYYRLAALDLHSFTTAHYVGVPDKDTLLQLDDDSLRKRLSEIKKAHTYDRNYKLKRIAYLMQFAGGAEKAYRILSEFTCVAEVQALMDMIANLFPRTFKDFPKSVEKMLRRRPWIISPFGFIRYFWDKDLQQAVAFLPSNCSHCTIQDALLRLHDKGVLQRFGMINFLHDAAWMHPRIDEVDECIIAVKEEFERPSTVLVNSLGAFRCGAEAQVGDSLDAMVTV